MQHPLPAPDAQSARAVVRPIRLGSVVPVVVTDALAAANAHDVRAFVRCFSARGSIDAWGMLFEGPSGITQWSEQWVVGYRVRFTDLLHLWEGATLAVHAQVHGDGYRGPATFTFHTSNELINALQIRN